jgi:hypothetical protein
MAYTFTVRGPVLPTNSTSTSATTQITLAQVDTAAIPGVGDITSLRWGMRITATIYELDSGADHNATMWKKETYASRNAGGGFQVATTPANGNSNSGGLIGSANSSTIAFDTSSNLVRLRLTPDDTAAMQWIATLACELEIFT